MLVSEWLAWHGFATLHNRMDSFRIPSKTIATHSYKFVRIHHPELKLFDASKTDSGVAEILRGHSERCRSCLFGGHGIIVIVVCLLCMLYVCIFSRSLFFVLFCIMLFVWIDFEWCDDSIPRFRVSCNTNRIDRRRCIRNETVSLVVG